MTYIFHTSKRNNLMNIEYSYNDKIPASTALSRINKASSISKPEYLIEDKYFKIVFFNMFFNV